MASPLFRPHPRPSVGNRLIALRIFYPIPAILSGGENNCMILSNGRTAFAFSALIAFGGALIQPTPALAEEPSPAKKITIAADAWCPINCDPADEHPGIGIELAKKIFEPLGYEINYVIVPWARALEDVRQGKIDAVVGANTSDDATLVFPKSPVAEVTDDFYIRTDTSFDFKDIGSLDGKRLGIIKDYGYDELLMAYVEANRKAPGLIQEVSGDTALDQNIKKLLAGRIDILVESGIVMNYKIHKESLGQQIRHAGSIPQGSVYLAFSPALPASAELAGKFDAGYEELKKAGILASINATYGRSAETEK